ncbi:MAG: ATP-grasp domain-containing protein [Thiotrichales bacterium]|nr:ATP-grasp domain-containing protein [Thiotrichales bacterium]
MQNDARGRVLLVAPPGSYRVHAYLEAACDLGIGMLVASEGAHALIPGFRDGLRVDFSDPDDVIRQIQRTHRDQPVTGVVATDDGTVELANRVAAALGLAHNAPFAARIARRKDLARTALAEAGLPVPPARRVDLRRPLAPQVAGIEFPCVVKPLALSASRGVIRADDLPGFEVAGRRAVAIARADAVASADEEERDTLLVESFVPGPEIALEGMLTGGALTVLAIFDKPDPLDGPFFEETIYVTPSRHPRAVQALAAERVRAGCAAYGLTEGPVHAELRLHAGEAWIIEIAARTIGGDCARLFTFGSGTSLEHLVLQRALGRSPDIPFRDARRAAGVLMIPTPGAGTLRRVEGVMAAGQVPGIREVSVTVREGYALTPLPEGGTYLGFVFALGDDPAGVEASLRQAQEMIRVVVAPSLAVEVAG